MEMLGTCKRFVIISMLGICKEHVIDMLGICKGHVIGMLGICKRHVIDMLGICKGHNYTTKIKVQHTDSFWMTMGSSLKVYLR